MASPSDFFTRLEIEGGGLQNFNNIGSERLLLSASMSLTVEQASEISFTMHDPNWAFLKSFGDKGPLEKNAQYGGVPYTVTGFSMDGGPSGQGGAQIRLQPRGIYRCRKITGALTRENITPTQFVQDSAANCGMKFVGQETPSRPSISRDVAEENSKDEANEWTTNKRLAAEEGFLIFESLNTLYFGSPQWLFDRQKELVFGLGMSVSDNAYRLMQHPAVTVSSSETTSNDVQFLIPLTLVGKIFPGNTGKLLGVPKPMGDTKLLITSVEYPLAGDGDMSITMKKPWVIEKQALQGAGTADIPDMSGGAVGGGGGAAGGNLSGNTAGERAVNACLKYLGTTYAWGGGSYNGPTKGIRDGGVADSFGDYNKVGFDCSGLMQYGWFQGSGGRVKLPRTTWDQRNAGPRISLAQAIPGDLCLSNNDGHIGMYMGNGKMVETQKSGDVVKVSNVRASYCVQIR